MKNHTKDHIKILITDNSEEIGTRLFDILREFKPVQVEGVARNCVQALIGLVGRIPDRTLLDLRHSDPEFQEVLIAFREISYSSIIIVLTNHYEMQQACLVSGAECFLSKSHQLEQVVEAFKEATRN